jgi:hypothetical protein
MRRVIRGGKAERKGCSISEIVGRDRAVGTATRYGLDGPGIGSLLGRDFHHASGPALGSTQPPVQRGRVIILGAERPVRGVDQPPLFKAKVQERV